MGKQVGVLFGGALTDATGILPVILLLFVYSFIIFTLGETPHYFDKRSHHGFSTCQELYGCSKINSPFRASP